QKHMQNHLKSNSNGITKRVIELDIKKCFDRISHSTIMANLIAPKCIKQGVFRCLKAGVNPEFPEQGTPQGGVVSPLLANVALNGIEEIHPSIRYADDMVIFLKPKDDAEKVLQNVATFLAERGMEISQEKTKITHSTNGFDFLGWNFRVQKNGKFRSMPSADNLRAIKKKIKAVANSSNYGAKVKAKKLEPIVRGWRNYHRNCKMDGSRNSLWFTAKRTHDKFLREKKISKGQAKKLITKAFPKVKWKENKQIKVRGTKSPYDGDLVYWSERNSKLYDNATARALKKQNHCCGQCGHKLLGNESVHLHHIDGNHDNWKPKNLMAIHQSCHQYIHSSQKDT
ncbi:MAG: RNA-dependent DNA polymerase, partial [Moorea sp. SIO3E2]|nr:RNA-dependent DNA polymerase [Moorena sp. SIO3E2]